ncbi:MAG: OmpA family protein [Phycisphaeraceae bacterium]|nr:OmpA family protein [Phycisphaerae bacterium]MBX3391535.1 OmpA family protein [Phycisphaeraceae bacterium]HRJ49344.1 flagellar motor protein MotB [Phycisphaerales bacterium]
MSAEEHKEDHGSSKHGSHGGGHAGHGAGHDGEHEGAPEWLISFADMVMLIMGFFVILLAMNMGPKATEAADGSPSEETSVTSKSMMLDFAISIREGFNNPVNIDSTDPKEQPLVRRLRERQTGRTIDEGPTKKGPQADSLRPTEYSAIGGTIVFDDGQAVLGALARQKIADIAARVGQLRFIVEVRGHTSPVETMRNEARARQLAHERAMAVAQALAVQGVPWRQMRLVSCGDSERAVARTYDRELERQNQRVEVILTRDVLSADPYTLEVNRPAADAAPPTGDQVPSDPEGFDHE